jgi:malate dehydrogenase (oxaloacetate-decarboxylating)(NADP+)
MKPQPILFAMANPDPEIAYEVAKAAVPDAIVATGRSDYPNQVNNVLGFPYLFRGALDCRARAINDAMKVAAVHALVALTREDVPDSVLAAYSLPSLRFGPDYILPKPFDPRVLLWVAPAVAEAAARSGVAREPIADLHAYRERLERKMERSKEILRPLMNRARLNPRRIVLTEGTNPRVIRAAQILVDERICTPILIGNPDQVHANSEGLGLKGVEIVDIAEGPKLEHYAKTLWKLRQRKGMTWEAARSAIQRPVEYGAMMVRLGDADGLVGGLGAPYAQTARPALQIIGTDPRAGLVSGAYILILKETRMFFADCTVNVHPGAAELAKIAINTGRLAASLGYTPRVAMLSYSDFGEHLDDPAVSRVHDAIPIVKAAWPGLVIDGEMQADTATNREIATAEFPFSAIQGNANVLIFPDLAAGNIAYKLLRDLGGATAIGPILLGTAKPFNVLALGGTVEDIVHMASVTAAQAIEMVGQGTREGTAA